jgi:hypothetical protein
VSYLTLGGAVAVMAVYALGQDLAAWGLTAVVAGVLALVCAGELRPRPGRVDRTA